MKRSRFGTLAVGACLLLLSAAVLGFQTGGSYHLLKKISLGAAEGGGEYFDYITFDAAARRVYLSHGTEVEVRSEEHTSELQSLRHLVCRLLLEKNKHFALCFDASRVRRCVGHNIGLAHVS